MDKEVRCPPCADKPSRHIFRLPAIDFSLADAVKTDVTFQVFKNNSTSGAYYTDSTISSARLDPDIPLKIIIHGWLSNETTYWYQPFRDALFKKGRHNCVYIDWYKAGGKKYDIAAANAKFIGGFIADFIIASNVKLKNVHIIGHSLGSHVAGFTGKAIIKKTGQKLGRITLTDPAALMFELPQVSKDDKAGEGDAEFVDVIHSDMGHYGCIDPIGHADFYPNSGKQQPGCPPLEDDARHIFRLPRIDFSLADAEKTDVTFQVFKNNSTEGVYYTDETIASAELDPELPFKVIIHGWLSNESSYWYQPIRDEYFKKEPHNVIFIDWWRSGGKMYSVAAANSRYIGGFIGDFIIASNVNLKKVHVIGHSLGSQVAGFVGKRIIKRTGRRIDRITMTDPAALMFELPEVREDERAGVQDADFVDVVHSDMGHYGFIDPIGTVDFYPNGGKEQPGCPPLEEDDNCSHARSNHFYIESINSSAFKAAPCESWDEYLAGKFDTNDLIVFGEDCPRTARGKYYFATNAEKPYAKG